MEQCLLGLRLQCWPLKMHSGKVQRQPVIHPMRQMPPGLRQNSMMDMPGSIRNVY